MPVSAIVAVSANHAIGRNGELPWHLPEDLKFFKRTTMGKPVIMGRKTFESLGRPLPGRLNVVLSRQADLQLPEGAVLCDGFESALAFLGEKGMEDLFVIGGGEIFRTAMPFLDKLYVTQVETVVPDADAFFPDIDHTQWKLVWEERHDADDRHPHRYTFQEYDRISL